MRREDLLRQRRGEEVGEAGLEDAEGCVGEGLRQLALGKKERERGGKRGRDRWL